MKKLNIFIVVGLIICACMIGMASADNCTEDNDFDFIDDKIICSGGCVWENWTATNEYFLCDDNITCLLTAFYENRTLIVFKANMTRISNHYEYNLSSIANFNEHQSGLHTGEFYCFHRDKGITEAINFIWSISSGATISTSGAYVQPSGISMPSIVEIQESFFKANKGWLILIGFCIFLGVLAYLDLRRNKIKKIAKQVKREINLK